MHDGAKYIWVPLLAGVKAHKAVCDGKIHIAQGPLCHLGKAENPSDVATFHHAQAQKPKATSILDYKGEHHPIDLFHRGSLIIQLTVGKEVPRLSFSLIKKFCKVGHLHLPPLH